MNVRLKKTFEFFAGLVYNDELVINQYKLILHMTTASMDINQQNIAYERISYWLNNVLNNVFLISVDSKLVDAYRATGNRYIIFPMDPVDQLVSTMLYLKLNAICEDRLVITQIELSSRYGDDIVYLHHADEDVGPFEKPGGWNDCRPFWLDTKKKKSLSKVISMVRMPEWSDIELSWQDPNDSDSSTVVFADFPKNDNK